MTRVGLFGGTVPDRMVLRSEGMPLQFAETCAHEAVEVARQAAPKLHGTMAGNLTPIYGDGWFGIQWGDKYAWYQERGIGPFTMKSLAGKTIPMWVNDPDGTEREKNPKAKIRTTVDGRIQILIFRRAAKMGQRKNVERSIRGVLTSVNVPASYPGAPGRINKRVQENTPEGLRAGQIAKTNVGVRWRHPGLITRGFIENGILVVAHKNRVSGMISVLAGDVEVT